MNAGTFTYKDAMAEFRLCSTEPWGDAMHWWFTIADELYFRDPSLVPEHWKYRPSPLGPTNDDDDYATGIVKGMSDAELLRLGATMDRYARIIKRAGRDY